MAVQKLRATVVRLAVVLAVLAASFASVSFATSAVEAQGLDTVNVWDETGGAVANPKQWKLLQSSSPSGDLGTANAADPALDDSAWANVNVRWRTRPGPAVANHFRKDFTLAEIGVDISQIASLQVGLQYDDTAVMYLNGVEVYRSIRGNLDPNYELYALGENIPYDVTVPFGGAERRYVQIPDLAGVNDCEFLPGCTASPYGGPNPPAIPVDLLRADGVNTWSITTWNQSRGGSGDSSFDHTFALLLDPVEPPFTDGDTVYLVNQRTGRYLDGDGRSNGWNVDTSAEPRWDDRWGLVENGDGTWLLQSKQRKRFLDADGPGNNWNVGQSRIARVDDRWEIAQQSDGSYRLRNRRFGRYLHESAGGNVDLVTNADWVNDDDGDDESARWRIVRVSDLPGN